MNQVVLVLVSLVFGGIQASLHAAVTEDSGYFDVARKVASAEDEFPIPPRKQVAYASAGASSDLYSRAESSTSVAFTPLMGKTFWAGDWNGHVDNGLTGGLAVDIPLSRNFSIELDGLYGNYTVSYLIPRFGMYANRFTQWEMGAIPKLNILTHSRVKPYIGFGLTGLYYQNLSRGPGVPLFGPFGGRYYDQWVGAGTGIIGTDVGVSENVALGVRGSLTVPIFNKPLSGPPTPWGGAAPGFEEASMVDSMFFRIMGTASFSF